MSRFRQSAAAARSRTSARLPLLVAALLVPAAATLWLRPHPDAASPLPASGDTTVIYGTAEFLTPTGALQTHVEEFPIAVPPQAFQALEIKNGAGGGSLRVDTLSVKLNGVELITTPFNQSVSFRSVPVTFEQDNTMEVTVGGQAGDKVTIWGITVWAERVIIYGPTTITRASGPLRTIVEEFMWLHGSNPPDSIHIVNGNANGTNRVPYAWITLNGTEVLGPADFGESVAAIDEEVSFPYTTEMGVRLGGDPGAYVTITATRRGGLSPVVTITSPPPGFVTTANQVTVSGSVQAWSPVTITLGNQTLTTGPGNTFEGTTQLLFPGDYTIRVQAADVQGKIGKTERTVTRDNGAPVLTVTAPQNGLLTAQTSVTVVGSVTDGTPTSVSANGVPLAVDTLGGVSGAVSLVEGLNVITVTATDAAGNTDVEVRTVTRDTQAPTLIVTEPENGATTTADSIVVSGNAVDSSDVTVTVNGQGVALDGEGDFTGNTPLTLGTNLIRVIAADELGNADTVDRSVTRQSEQQLPPDPATVATPIIATEASLAQENTAFLYTGADPIQTGVEPGTIDFVRAAVIRGRVVDRDLDPLTAVLVTVHDHPELGSTQTRSDGRFDLAVNGGGVLVLDFQKAGYLGAQRHVDAPWQTYALPDDVILLAVDTVVTVVDLSDTTVQVARGSVQEDDDGPRQATAFVEPGTQAFLVHADGSVDTLGSLALRATEFTVGDNGPAAMPAVLPPASHFTYAVQVTADEQLAAGPGAVVEFSQPVPLYVENFLDFPVGAAVPVGAYDPSVATWRPEPNGMVLRVVGTDGLGRALLDINGDGVADNDSVLAFNGIDPLERIRLAGTYPVDSELWRVNIIETLPYDLNWPFVLVGGTQPAGDVDGPCTDREADLLRCTLQVQTAFQSVGIVGSPFTLNYASDRAAGNVAERTLEIALVGDTVPPFLERVDLQIDIAGRRFDVSFTPEPNLSYTFTWDGLDVYGRKVQATQPAHVRIGYLYPVLYRNAPATARSFGQPCVTAPCELDAEVLSATRALRRVWQDLPTTLGGFDAAGVGLGGFTFDVQHAYDPIGEILHHGDGTRRNASAAVDQVSRFAGTGDVGPAGDPTTNGVPATQSVISFPRGVTVGPDGSIYFADNTRHRVRKVDPDGIITTVAGTGVAGFLGDGGPANAARLNFPSGLALGPDGSLYVSDINNVRIRRVAPDGIITTFAGTGTVGFSGDGGPATAATLRLSGIGGVGVGQDGSVYIADQNSHRIRRVAPDGVISTFAGNANSCFGSPSQYVSLCGENVPATVARLVRPGPVAVGPDGSVYFAQDGSGTIREKIRKVTPDGLIHTVAGGDGPLVDFTDGAPALQTAMLSVNGLAVALDGTVYASHTSSNVVGEDIPDLNHILRITRDGVLYRLAGTGVDVVTGDGGPALQATLDVTHGVTVGHDGSVIFADRGEVRRIKPPLPGLFAGTQVVVSEDGKEIYVFSPAGRQLLTLQALTQDTTYRFLYDAGRRLTAIVDRDGRATSVERDGQGRILALIAPSGVRTEVARDGLGSLASVGTIGRAPALFVSDSVGRLMRVIAPGGDTISYSYDSQGRMTRVVGTAGALETDRAPVGGGARVDLSSTGVLSGSMTVTTTVGGGSLAVGIQPGGLQTSSTTDPDGRTTTTLPSGVVVVTTPTADRRFGLQAPGVVESITTPSGRQRVSRRTRTAVLSDPNDPSTIVLQIDSLIVNGQAATEVFDKVEHTVVRRSMAGREGMFEIDKAGRVLRSSLGALLPVSHTYDSVGQLLQSLQGVRSQHWTYTADGLVATFTNALGQTDSMFYAAGRLIRRVGPDGARVALFDYDSAGNITSVTPPGRPAHLMTYGAAGRMLSYAPPEVGGQPGVVRLLYDADGRVTRMLRPDSTNLTTTYDSAGRRSAIELSEGTYVYTYEPGTGRLSQAEAPGGVVTSYEHDGHLVTQTSWSGSTSGSVRRAYSGAFRLISQVVEADTVAYAYDADGLVTTVGGLSMTRDPSTGMVVSTALGGLTTGLSYDGYAAPIGWTVFFDSLVILQVVDTFDLLGRRVGRREVMNADTTSYAYAYDDAGRLQMVVKDATAQAEYQYDLNGNLLSLTTASGADLGTYDAQDRLISFGGVNYAYTLSGDLARRSLGGDTTWYHYDALGNLREVILPDSSHVEYLIDGEQRRTGRRVDGAMVQSFLYDGTRLVAELDSQGELVSRFVYGEHRIVPEYMVKGGITYRLVAEPGGTIRLVVDVATGAIAQRLDYDAYGRVVLDTEPGFQPFGFRGGLTDPATGLVRFGARDYDPFVGRWTTKDPMLLRGDANVYGYALGDPVNLTDVDGEFTLTEMATTLAMNTLVSALGGFKRQPGFANATGMLQASAELALFAKSAEVAAATRSREAVSDLLDIWATDRGSPHLEDAIAEAMTYNQEMVATVARKAAWVAIGANPIPGRLSSFLPASGAIVKCIIGANWETRHSVWPGDKENEGLADHLLWACVMSPLIEYLGAKFGEALFIRAGRLVQ